MFPKQYGAVPGAHSLPVSDFSPLNRHGIACRRRGFPVTRPLRGLMPDP